MIVNPFVEDSQVIFLKDISKDRLIESYRSTLNVDVRSILSSTDRISLCKCKESDYQFFYPFNITGDSKFYEKLQENEWYYLPWKWEHQLSSKLINEGDRILEVGCGKGDFIKYLRYRYKDIQCTGLELNESSITSNGKLEILNRKIEDFSLDNEGKFDLVCSFQVLEHIPAVNSFLKSMIRCLKNNGILVISVPNNDSFIRYDKFSVLNMPPHHMGLWNEESLRFIGEYYNLELVEIAIEPLQEYHFDWYINLICRKIFRRYLSSIILRSIKYLDMRKRIKNYLRKRANKIRGHTILIAFRKVAIKN